MSYYNVHGSKNIPVYNVNKPNGGPQQPAFIAPDQRIFSSSTGNLVSIGPIPYGTMGDAPAWHPNYGKPFHVVEVDQNGDYMTHRQLFGRR